LLGRGHTWSDALENLIRIICQKEGLEARIISTLSGGQVNQVFLIDDAHVIRIGSREDAFQRLKQETELVQRLTQDIPVPRVIAFGQHNGHVYQIQQFIRGQKLHSAWKHFPPEVQDRIVAELATHLKTLHKMVFPQFGYFHLPASWNDSWLEFFTDQFTNTLAEIKALGIRIAPDLLAAAVSYFDEHKQALQEGVPALVHGDLWPGNILVEQAKIAAILDFEYSVQAPRDFELVKMEDFCLYPNDYAEEENEVFCTADFANFIPLLRKHDPELFETRRLRERLNLYHLESTLSDYLAWRKANLGAIPIESLQAMGFVNARITNILFKHGTRMF
jgi:aminoglycoside phosphotransferase (APT) family kinase protein